jgi:tetratricopeptide (TPR) repeat protein
MARVPFSVFALSCLVFAALAAADDYKDCQAADPDLRIKSCSAIVARKNETPGNRAIAYNNLGAAYREKGEQDRAVADYGRALELNPKYASAYNNRGVAYRDKGEYDRAVADYGRALELNPNDDDVYYNRGLAYRDKGEYDRAIADYSRAVQLNAKHAYAYKQRFPSSAAPWTSMTLPTCNRRVSGRRAKGIDGRFLLSYRKPHSRSSAAF